jgi:hypothetical protein
VVGHTREPDGPQEDGLEFLELFDAVLRHETACAVVVFATPGESLPIEINVKAMAGRLENPDSLRDHFQPDSVPGYYRDII